MFQPFMRELAEIRGETLRNDGSPRSARARGHTRRAIGMRLVALGERLAGDRREVTTIRIGGKA